jgi:hypothetical protein
MVLLPEPEGPTIATLAPAGIVRSMSCRMMRSVDFLPKTSTDKIDYQKLKEFSSVDA